MTLNGTKNTRRNMTLSRLMQISFLILLSGCSTPGGGRIEGAAIQIANDGDEATYVVVGFAILKVRSDEKLIVIQERDVGAFLSSLPYPHAGIGYHNANVVLVSPAVDAVIEIINTGEQK